VVLSIVVFCVSSLPSLSGEIYPEWQKRWDVVECVIIAVFTVEYVLRLCVTPLPICGFMFRPFNVIDVLSILPFWVEAGTKVAYVVFASDSTKGLSTHLNFAWIRLLRLGRLFRIFKMSKYLTSLEVIINSFVWSLEGLTLLFAALVFMVVLFSAFVWFAERGEYDVDKGCFVEVTNKNVCTLFESVPMTFYWSVTTLTTVGYGDMAPKSALGQFLTCFIMVCGILVLAMPVTILCNNFSEAWSQNEAKKARKQLEGKLASTKDYANMIEAKHIEFSAIIDKLHEVAPSLRGHLHREANISGSCHGSWDTGFSEIERGFLASASSFRRFVIQLKANIDKTPLEESE
jgi:voltage-gated potassium channel Kch